MSDTAFVLNVHDVPKKQAGTPPPGSPQENEEVVDPPQDDVQDDPPQTSADLEAKARTLGWRSKEEFKGKGEWVDAEEFMRRGQESLPLAVRRIQNLERQLAETQKVAQEYKQFSNEQAEKKWKAHYETLMAERAVAVQEGDGEKFLKAEAALEEHKATKPVAAAAQQTLPPEVDAWQQKNTWINTNVPAASYAMAIGQDLKSKGYATHEILQAMEEAAREKFPELFEEEPPPRKQSGAERPKARTASKAVNNGRTFADLPPDAQAACDRFIKRGMVKDRAQYLREYQWD